MTRRAKSPAAVDAASGGDRDVLAGAERADDIPDARPSKAPGIEERTRWLDQVLEDPELTNAAFKVAYGVSAALLRDGDRAHTSLATLAASLGRSGDSPAEVRAPLETLEARGHLRITRRVGRGNHNRYELLFKAPPKRSSPPLDVEPRVSLERLPALLTALRDVVRAAKAAGLPID